MDSRDTADGSQRSTRIRRYGRFILTPFLVMLSLVTGYWVMLGSALVLLRGTPRSPLVGYAALHVVFVSGSLAAGLLAAWLECWNARKSGFRSRATEVGCLVAWGCLALMICTSGRSVAFRLPWPWFLVGLCIDIPVVSLAGLAGRRMSKVTSPREG